MKRLILFGLLALLATGCSGRTPETEAQDPQSTPPTTETTPSPTAELGETGTAADQTVYTNDDYGFEFTYPDRYYIDSPLPVQSDNPDLLETIEIWQQEDYEDIQNRMGEGTELPPNITVQVFDNAAQRPLADWKQELSNDDDRSLTLDGQEAIAYTSTGLYEHDNVLVGTPSGQHVLLFSVGYFDAASPMREDFEAIVSSVTFD